MTMTPLLPVVLPFFLLFVASSDPTPINVGVILDHNSTVGQLSNISINMAIDDFYKAHPNFTTRIHLHFRHSSDVLTAVQSAVDLITADGVTAILGPQTSSSAALVASIGAKCHVPVISFSATSCPFVPSSQSPQYFVRAAVADSAVATPIAALVQFFGWRRVVPIYEHSVSGFSSVTFLVDALAAVGSQVPYRLFIPASASDDRVLAELYRLKTMQTRVFVVHVTSALAARIFTGVRRAGMMEEGFVWIVTDGVASSIASIDSLVVLDSMQGVLGVKPHIPRSRKLKELQMRCMREFLRENPSSDITELSTFGFWAYDAVFALAIAIESSNISTNYPPTSFHRSSSTNFSQLPILKSGQILLNSVLTTEFEGVAGKFKLVNGELNVSAFEIMNIVGEKGHGIGFWTAERGLTRRLDRPIGDMKKAVLGPVSWPGEGTELPRGFVYPTSGEKMRIAVPGDEDTGFQALLNVRRDPATNVTVASGYAIEVFEAAVRRLPYALPFEYVAYTDETGKSAWDYNTMVNLVPERYDAVVGDVTITANRSELVDFTVPYIISSVSMVVPIKDERSRSSWIFFKPFKPNLWLTCTASFLFTSLVVWVIEHRDNCEFRGSPTYQINNVLYFFFSTLFFSLNGNVVNSLSKAVLIVWIFVVLILQSSYTASLTSMLTMRHFQPTTQDLDELRDNNENVGYLASSFVKELLLKRGFHESRLLSYKSPQEYADALSKGSKRGGVAAVVDEVPYLRVFLRDYCDNYTMSGHPIKTGGFGFVFPKGSHLVPDLSRAILNLTESNEMSKIRQRWFGDQTTCPSKGSNAFSPTLDYRSFRAPFFFTATVSVTALLIFLVALLKHYIHLRTSLTSRL